MNGSYLDSVLNQPNVKTTFWRQLEYFFMKGYYMKQKKMIVKFIRCDNSIMVA